MRDSVAVVAFDQISPFHLSVPSVVMGEDRTADGVPRYDVRICAVNPGPVATNAGYDLVVAHGLDVLAEAGTVIVPSWRDPAEIPPEPLLTALKASHERGARVVGLCLGAFVLAAAGLLDGRRATTHWRYAPDLALRYPAIRVDPGVLWVDEADVITSAGTAAALDCCLYLLHQDRGADIANRVARRLVLAATRTGSQAQFVERPIPGTAVESSLPPVLFWMRRHLDQPLRLDDLAARAHVSRRSFTRSFRATTGMSPHQWILTQRLQLARDLLETTTHPLETVAAESGLGTGASLRQHFQRELHLSPSAYRRAFSKVPGGSAPE